MVMANFKKQSGLTLADSLRKAVLQSAIQGQLVAQNADDGLASELLYVIKAEKERLIAEKVIKKEKPLPPISDDEKPFDIPDNWIWVRLGDIGQTNIGLTYDKKDISNHGTIVLRSGNIQDGKIDLNDLVKVEGKIPESKICQINDLLICARNGSKKLVGKTAIIDKDGYSFGAFMAILRTRFYKYVYYYLASPYFRSDFDGVSTTTINQITQDNLKNRLIPLPPLKEQKRIVAKLDEILPQLDDLAKSETALNALQSAFPKQMQSALLQSAISGQLTEQLESDGKASDLLTAIQKEKQRLIDEKIIKREKPLAEITDDEKPFDIPDNWVWVRLGDIGSWNSGATPSRTKPEYYLNGTINWLKTGDLTDGIINETSEKITDLAVKESSVVLQPVGAVLMAMYGATIGKVGLLEIEATTNQACCGCRPFTGVFNWYVFYCLIANRKNFINMGAGGAQPNISKEKIVNTLIPLPPLAEQERIVAKLDELLPQVQSLTK